MQLIGYDLAVLCDCRTVVPLSCTHGKHYPGGTTPRRLPRSIACCLPSLTACRTHSGLEHPSLVILPILKPRNAYNPRTHSEPSRQLHVSRGRRHCLASIFCPRLQHPSLETLAILKPRKAFIPRTHPAHSRQLHDARWCGLCLEKSLCLAASPIFLRHTQGSQSYIYMK